MPPKYQDFRVCRNLQTARTFPFLASLTRLHSNRLGSMFAPAGQEGEGLYLSAFAHAWMPRSFLGQ
jgi:hypothetical protein